MVCAPWGQASGESGGHTWVGVLRIRMCSNWRDTDKVCWSLCGLINRRKFLCTLSSEEQGERGVTTRPRAKVDPRRVLPISDVASSSSKTSREEDFLSSWPSGLCLYLTQASPKPSQQTWPEQEGGDSACRGQSGSSVRNWLEELVTLLLVFVYRKFPLALWRRRDIWLGWAFYLLWVRWEPGEHLENYLYLLSFNLENTLKGQQWCNRYSVFSPKA